MMHVKNLILDDNPNIEPVSKSLSSKGILGFFAGFFSWRKTSVRYLGKRRWNTSEISGDREFLREEALFENIKTGEQSWIACSRWMGAVEKRITIVANAEKRRQTFGLRALTPEEAFQVVVAVYFDEMNWYPG